MNRVYGALLCCFLSGSVWAAGIGGRWRTVSGRGAAGLEIDFDFAANGHVLTGTMTDSHGTSKLSDGHIQGDELSFVIAYNLDGQELRITYEGKLRDDQMDFGLFLAWWWNAQVKSQEAI